MSLGVLKRTGYDSASSAGDEEFCGYCDLAGFQIKTIKSQVNKVEPGSVRQKYCVYHYWFFKFSEKQKDFEKFVAEFIRGGSLEYFEAQGACPNRQQREALHQLETSGI